MRVLSPPRVADLVRERGGKLYVWTDLRRCCSGGITYLSTGSETPGGRIFRPVDAEGFELFFDPGRLDPPAELHLEVKGLRRKRVEAYWDGCVFAM